MIKLKNLGGAYLVASKCNHGCPYKIQTHKREDTQKRRRQECRGQSGVATVKGCRQPAETKGGKEQILPLESPKGVLILNVWPPEL